MKDGGPAFPYSIQRLQSTYHQEVKGMSLRDWFAGQALIGKSHWRAMKTVEEQELAS